MNYNIFNRGQVSLYIPYKNEILISITDVNCAHFQKEFAHVSNKYAGVVRLRFDDTDVVGHSDAVAMTCPQAINVLHFVADHIDTVDVINVNCEGGLSRSAGVCAGLAKIIDRDDHWVFAQKPFLNKFVYRMILETNYKYGILNV